MPTKNHDGATSLLSRIRKKGKRDGIHPAKSVLRDARMRAAPIRDSRGRFKGRVRWIRESEERRAREGGLQQLNRMVQALSRSSQAMARAKDEVSYLDQVCRIIVEDSGCCLVWIGYKMDDPKKSVRPMAWAGFDEGYISALRVTWADEPLGQGPSGAAVRMGQPAMVRNMESDPGFLPWREEALARGFASSLALPLKNDGEAFGALTVYSPVAEAFSDAQVRVLGELAGDLAHGILTLRLRDSERKAQEALQEKTSELQRLNDELERRVLERTVDLVRANEELTAGILERDLALEALKHSEEKLRHSQKMEAIGTLAGGVAHDFNNLLQVITGYSEVTLDHMDASDPLRINLETIQRAGQRGATLTRQLLAFSRKQVLAPVILDLNALFREMERFFLRVLKEHIRLVFDLQPGLGHVEADPGQMEQVIMNLVVNARDAMPRGGTLMLETRGLPGFSTFSVTDTGMGMAPDVMARIFEPFFTTKEVGKGTGLGLSTALGIVEQSGGSLEVRSTLDEGTTFTVSLPLAGPGLLGEPAARQEAPESGTETILLVEDDEGVRRLTAHHLAASGYQVLEARDSTSAMEMLLGRKGPVHLLLTDVVMPGLGGGELAETVRELRPGIRVGFMSGYPVEVLSSEGVPWTESVFIAKPFDRAKLLTMVRRALDA